jgi:nucleotide-binding universal stress UspA family protein
MIQNILFATDFSSTANIAFSYAAAIAVRYNSRLTAAHVINTEPFKLLECESGRAAVKEAREEAARRIAQLFSTAQLANESSEVVITEGAAVESLLEIIQRKRIDLAVVGTHGRRASNRLLLGSTAEELFRMASCPVLTIGPKAVPYSVERQIRHVLYPVEFVPDKSEAAGYAISLADRYGAILTVMNVKAPPPDEWFKIELERWFEPHLPQKSNLRDRVRFNVECEDSTVDSILEFVAKANVDVIVMSVRHLDSFVAALPQKPDIAYQLVSRVTCPVLTVR